MSKKVFISTSSFAKYDEEPLQKLQSEGFEVVLNPHGRKLTEEESLQFLQDVDALLAGTETLTQSVLRQAKQLRVISRCGVGLDNVDLDVAKELGIQVFNTPDSVTQSVAELTIGFMLNLLRKVSAMDQEVKQGVWQKQMGSLLMGKRVGIIGFGRIGQKVASLVSAFGANVSYHDIEKKDSDYDYQSLEQLLTESDIISVHVSSFTPGNPLIGAKEINQMK